MIDFGLAKRFRDPKTGEHIPYRDGKNLTGEKKKAEDGEDRRSAAEADLEQAWQEGHGRRQARGGNGIPSGQPTMVRMGGAVGGEDVKKLEK